MYLITGATGMLGSYFLLHLASQNQKIRAIYRSEERKMETLTFIESHNCKAPLSNIEWIRCELDDLPAMESALLGVRTVIHTAALVSFDKRFKPKIYQTNVLLTRELVNHLIGHSIQLLYISSVSAEKTPHQSYYGYSKYLGELEVHRGIQEGLHAYILRPGVILGTYFWDRPSGSIIKKMTRSFLKLPVGGTGFISAKTVVEATIYILEHQPKDQTHVLVEENWSYKELAKQISAHTGARVSNKPLSKAVLKAVAIIQGIAGYIFRTEASLTREVIEALTSTTEYPTLSQQSFFDSMNRTSLPLELKKILNDYL